VNGAIAALAALAVLAAAGAWWVAADPTLVARGQDAAGEGMFSGFVAAVGFLVAGALALAAAVLVAASWGELPWWARIVGLAPAAAGLVAIAGAVRASRRRRARARADAYAARIAEPAGLVVEADDRVFLALYEALRPFIGDVELSCRHPLALVDQQRDWLPRASVLFVNGDALAAPDSRELLDLLRRSPPRCPLVLHGGAAAEPALRQTGWGVTVVPMDGPDWVASRWLPVARELMARVLHQPASA
jgi:hypothetical protein